MRLTALGHIAFLLELEPSDGARPVRILSDPWLSDYAIGDHMGRFPRVRFDAASLSPLHGIFLSHSHTDHFDPYTLVRLWRELDPKPAILIPESLSFLEPLIREFLAGAEVIVLRHLEDRDFHGVTLRAFFNPEMRATNEDDVMVLVADTGREVLVNECDAVLPFYDPETRALLRGMLLRPEVETVVFLTAKNELEATMSSLSAANLEDRLARVSRSIERTYEEIEEIFASGAAERDDDEDDRDAEEDLADDDDLLDGDLEDAVDWDGDDEEPLASEAEEERQEAVARSARSARSETAGDVRSSGGLDESGDELHDEDEAPPLWSDPRVVRLIGGQGMCYPQKIRPEWNRVLFPIRLPDRARMEREVAESLGYPIAIEPFTPGMELTIEGGSIAGARRVEWLDLLDEESDRAFDPKSTIVDDFPIAPLRDEIRDEDAQAELVRDLLDRRFLPALIGARDPPVEHLLAERGGTYRIRIRYGTRARFRDRDHVLRFARMRFTETDADASEPDEHYWANDIEDVVAGRADEFSVFCRRPLPAPSRRFWSVLGLPYLNEDLIERKLRLHFERARDGLGLEEWALAPYGER